MKHVFLLLVCVTVSLISRAQEITGVLGAFPPEMVLLQSKMENKADTVIQRIRFSKGILNGRRVVLAQTGIGKVNAAIVTTLMIEHFAPREIIFSGIAGAIDTTLAAGDIVIGTRLAYHDYGMLTDTGMRYGPTRNTVTLQLNPLYFNCDSLLIRKATIAGTSLRLEKIMRETGMVLPEVRPGIIVTGDVFVSTAAVTTRLRNELGASATEMEGAAIAQTCFQQNIPFLVIRSLSDKANSTARKDMMSFLDIASRNSAMLVMAILATL
jgi:adenosylhomocysteine nucleosidase